MFQVYSGVRLGIYEWRLIIMAMESVVPDACCFYDVRLGLYERRLIIMAMESVDT